MPGPEAITRKQMIDPAIERAGWALSDGTEVGIEIPVDGYNAAPANGITDYVLLRENGEVLAVVEAKKTTHEPRLAQQQTEHYLTEVAKRQSFRPFGFMTNGIDTHFWDSEVAPPRPVRGFFSRADLERMLSLRQSALPLSTTAINSAIVNRAYQLEAVKRICQAFEVEKQRKTLLVMATGTGKTRTAMAIIDLFIRADQARNILFVADRDALVEQAIEDGFEKYIPGEPCARITTASLKEEQTSRLYAVTLQTLSNVCERFTPGYFDLVIFDEVHRSIFNKWEETLDYFDGRMIGLTATPANFIDRNTFVKFDCFDGTPTFLYTYEQAIEDGYLVPFDVYSAKTKFQRTGIHGANLSEEERNTLTELGIDPDDIDFSGADLERLVTNRDTLRRQWQEVMDTCYRDQSGQLPGKTIVFATTQEHVVRLVSAFEEMYPQWPKMAQVITSKSEYRGQAISAFKKQEEPRIAISVDMLETGIDVPEVVNLVFMRPINSRIKMAQMLGRGTRGQGACLYPSRLPNGMKERFLVMDFWENDFGQQAGAAPAANLPVLVSLFNTRLKLAERFLQDKQSAEYQRLTQTLRAMIAQIPLDSYSVKQVQQKVGLTDIWRDDFWRALTPAKLKRLHDHVGPLLRYAAGVDVAGATFTHKIERLKLMQQDGRDTSALVQDIAEDVARLPTFALDDPQCKEAVALVESGAIATASSLELDGVIEGLANQMRHKRSEVNPILELDLKDYIASRGYIVINRTGEQVYVDEYRKRVEQRILGLAENQPTLQAIQRGQSVTDAQLISVERTLRQELGGEPLELTDANLRRAFGGQIKSLLALLRETLDLDPAMVPDYQDLVSRQFDEFLANHQSTYNADQLRFLRAVKAVLARRGHLARNDLYDDPAFSAFGDDAVARLFTAEQIDEVLTFTAGLAA